MIPTVSPVVATLVAPDAKVLPGVPFEMWIDLRNPSDMSVGVGLCAELLVHPDQGDPFTITFGGEGRPWFPTLLPEQGVDGSPVTYLVLRPHASQTLTLPILPEFEGPRHLDDHRLSRPGRYRMALRLDFCWPGFTVPQKSLLPRDFLGAVTTSEVVVERVTPSGGDATVWRRMQELTDGKWASIGWLTSRNGDAGRTLVTEILRDHRDSNYYPYAVAVASFGAVGKADLQRRLDAIERFPSSPIVEMLHEQVLLATRGACGLQTASAVACEKATARLKASKRPTTRIRAFGREDEPEEPCPPEYECEP